jgi:DNA ligase-associated metallophosphoesterase
MDRDESIVIAGETLRLLPERAVFWERAQTLLVADLHWGKAAAFRAAAVPVPRGTTADDLGRLTQAVERTRPRRLVFLGDLWHAKAGRSDRLHDVLFEWRQRHAGLAVELVRGNHDRRAGDPPADWGIFCRDEPVAEGPFVLAHYPHESEAGYTLAGHLHPAAALSGPGRQRLRLPCFWFGRKVGVLPAFGSFTGCADVRPGASDKVFVIAGREVVSVANNRVEAFR